jgi:hypothetical protein
MTRTVSAHLPFPGTPAVLDGSEAIASIETRLAEVACAYPITPSTTMAAIVQAAVADGRTNLWGTPLRFIEPESEHSSASAAEGSATSGARVTNWASLPDRTNDDFLVFVRTEGRFASPFAPDGTPSAEILATQADRLANWRTLRELAGAA